MSTHGQTTAGPAAAAADRPGERSITDPSRDSYYGQPVLKPPVWKWEIPVYFFFGGMAGASAPLALAAGLRGDEALARGAAVTAAVAGGVVSPALLVADLGVPRRFLNMLRVVKVTSPMSVGAWVLAGFGPAAVAGAASRLGLLPRVLGAPAEAAAAVLGPVLATYTAALVATTSVPVWHEARRELPFVFAGSSLASAGGWHAIITPYAQAGAARRMAVAGAALELSAGLLMERRLGELGEPYRTGSGGRLARAAKALTLAGGAGMAASGAMRSRAGAAAAGACLAAGAFAERWAIFTAGKRSAEDPAATVRPQRARRAASPRS